MLFRSTGVTLYTDTVLRGLPSQPAPRRLFVPAGADPAAAARLRAEGWVTVAGLAPGADAAAEAKRLNCGHRLDGETLIPVA